MKKMFFEEYSEELNNVRTLLLQYFLEFQQLRGQAKTDLDEGIISDAEYSVISNYRIDEYHMDSKGGRSKYSLPKAKVDYVKKYGLIDENGDLLLDSLKPEYTENLEKLKSIFESTRIFYFYDNLSLSDAKAAFSGVISEYYDKIIEELNAALGSDKEAVNISGRIIKVAEIPTQIEKLTLHKQEALDRISTETQEGLYNLISKFYAVDYTYYDWYKVRKLQKDATDNNLCEKRRERLERISSMGVDAKSKQASYEEVSNNLVGTHKEFKDFSLAVLPLVEPKKQSIFRRIFRKKNNLDDLREIFVGFYNLPGVIEYVKGLKDYNITDQFQIYMSNNYPMINYVDANQFKKDFLTKMNAFFEKKISTLGTTLSGIKGEIDDVSESLLDNIEAANEEAIYAEVASRSLSVSVSLEGYDEVEQQRFFSDLKEYFATSYVEEFNLNTEMRNQDELRNGKRGLK